MKVSLTKDEKVVLLAGLKFLLITCNDYDKKFIDKLTRKLQ